jgi:alkylated DNA nucleotide flippase Atl1
MHAKEQTLKQLLEGEKQYVVPLYQRTYAWQRHQLQQLWNDLMLQADALEAEAPSPGHFLGSLVLAPTRAVAGGPSRWLVVDGQQRLTSLSLALSALRDHVRSEDPKTADRIQRQFLINEYQEARDRLKVLPTQDDRAAFEAVLMGDPGDATGNIGDAYRIFRELLVAADDPDDDVDMHRVEQSLVGRLDLVAITTDADDNVHRIFQSLNNTGMQLTQGDLLRNHYFMLLPTRADDVYTHVWRPMEKKLGVGNLETLAYVDLLLEGFERASRGDTYRLQAERIRKFETDQDAVEQDILRLARRAEALAPVLDPDHAPPGGLREGLSRLRSWGTEATQVVMLAAVERLHAGSASPDQVNTAATLCESYLVRRMLSGRSGAGVNRILAEAARTMLTADDMVGSLRSYLSGPRRGWPNDELLRSDIQTRNFYWAGKASQRMFVLRRLEESFKHKEQVDWAAAQPQIEHVLPQTLTTDWESGLLDPDDPALPPADVHQQWVHRLGNLTLTSYNPELSNAPYPKKRLLYRNSHFDMTRQIAEGQVWGPAQIKARADALADLAIDIWPGPVGTRAEVSDPWRAVRQLLVALPEGTWTTYGDIGAVSGHHPVALGQFLGGSPLPNAWRVMTSSGKISAGFHWTDERTESPQAVLEAEGVQFDSQGVANPTQRLRPADLATLLGIEVDSDVPAPASSETHPEITENFWRTLRLLRDQSVVDGLSRLVSHWASLGGTVEYGIDPQLVLYPMLRAVPHDPWPFGVYPDGSGTIEVPFQWMKIRPPFDDTSVREQMRIMLNEVPGIEIPVARLGLRPRFALSVLQDPGAVNSLMDILSWFVTTATDAANTQVQDTLTT